MGIFGKSIADQEREIDNLVAMHLSRGCEGGKCEGGNVCARARQISELRNKLAIEREKMRHDYH
jgi:hypothetical protein